MREWRQLNVMILEPEQASRSLCCVVAAEHGHFVLSARTVADAARLVRTCVIDVVLIGATEFNKSEIDSWLAKGQCAPSIVILGRASHEKDGHSARKDIYKCLEKPLQAKALHVALKNELEPKRETCEQQRAEDQEGFGGLIGRAPEMERLYRIIAKAAYSRHPVLILGESGTGKELVARSIHFSGPLRDKPFIPVDCGSLVPTLIESELFGYVRGAFTGAVRSKEGLMAIAEGGTIFLDEVGELPVDLQAKLLRALQEKEIRPVGSTRLVPINVRILAATHRDLEVGVAQGTFRRDLYYRLNVLSLRIPPLREHKQDIPLLVGHFLKRLLQSAGIRREFSDEALSLMMAHDWPGNVRELENVVERACALSSGPGVHLSDLPTPGATLAISREHQIVPMAEMEKQAILDTIEQVQGDKLLAARLLGIGKTTIYRRLKKYLATEMRRP